MKKWVKTPEIFSVDEYYVGLDFYEDEEGDIYPFLKYFNRETDNLIFVIQQGKVDDPKDYAEWFYLNHDEIIHLAEPICKIVHDPESGKENVEFEVVILDYDDEEPELLENDESPDEDAEHYDRATEEEFIADGAETLDVSVVTA